MTKLVIGALIGMFLSVVLFKVAFWLSLAFFTIIIYAMGATIISGALYLMYKKARR